MVEIRGKIPLEDIIQKFSVWGRYHALTAVWVGIVLAWNNMCYTNYVFITEKVNYRCREYDSLLEGFNATHADYAETESNVCHSNSTTSCTEWVYEDPYSFVAEFDLACAEWKRTLVGSMHSFGCMVGLLVVGPLSDRIGRKPLVVITGVLGGVCGLTRSFTTNYWLYVVLEFLEAAIGDPCSPIYMISIEMVSTDKRVLYNWICSLGYSLGGILYPFIFKLIPYWRNCLRVIYTPALLFISYAYLIDESTRWLLIKGKKVEAVTVIEKAAIMNNLDLEMDLNMISYEDEKGASFRRVIVQTFKSRPMLTRFIVCSSWWIASTFVNHGLAIHSVSLQGNKYINYALTSLMDVPGKAIITLILIKYRRKMPLIISFLAAAVLCIAQPFASGILPWLSVTLFMCGKVLSSGYFKTTYIFTSELFPTYTRNSMHALCSSVGRLGSIAAPQMPLLVAYWSGLPPIIFGLVSLVAGVLTFLVPDTSEDPLPDTVDQAETLGKIAGSVNRKEPKDETLRFRKLSARIEEKVSTIP